MTYKSLIITDQEAKQPNPPNLKKENYIHHGNLKTNYIHHKSRKKLSSKQQRHNEMFNC